MYLLLDSHVWIWFITNNPQLPPKVKSLILDTANRRMVSIASLWEIGIKHSLGRLKFNADLKTIFQLVKESGIDLLPLSENHILKLNELAYHHKDPFDRIMIAQAIGEGLTVVTKDGEFGKYPIKIFWN